MFDNDLPMRGPPQPNPRGFRGWGVNNDMLLPSSIQTFALGGFVDHVNLPPGPPQGMDRFKGLDLGSIDGFKKGGKIRRRRYAYRQKQKQRQSTNIKINIGGDNTKEKQSAQPRIITQYIGGTQPLNLSELINKMNSIENKIVQQQPVSLVSDVLRQRINDTLEARLNEPSPGTAPASSSSSTPDGDIIPDDEEPSSSSSSSSSAQPATTDDDENMDDTGLTWEGAEIYVGPSGKLKYLVRGAGNIKTGYLSSYARSAYRKSKLPDLYEMLKQANIKFKPITNTI